jgi:hypothetical protein
MPATLIDSCHPERALARKESASRCVWLGHLFRRVQYAATTPTLINSVIPSQVSPHLQRADSRSRETCISLVLPTTAFVLLIVNC